MSVSEAQRRASEKYRKEKVKQLATRFYPGEYDLYDWAKSQGNVAGYLKRLIREDMERARG